MKRLIIIGAGRSGTNMLRDSLASLAGVSTWPCDEINYIWRYGNRELNHDELKRADVTTSIRKYVNRKFDEMQKTDCLVEKTCANSLRVGYVDEVIKGAQFLHIVRDPRDVVASAMKRWTARMDYGYILKKARYVPICDLWYYAARYARYRLERGRNSQKRIKSWGPRYAGIDDDLKKKSLSEVASIQWMKCVESANEDFRHIDEHRVCEVRYEALVRSPSSELKRVLEASNLEYSEEEIAAVARRVSPKSVGNWQRDLTKNQIVEIENIVGAKMDALGYQRHA